MLNNPDTVGEYDTWDNFAAGATIAPGAVYVVCHTNAAQYIQDRCDEFDNFLSNGDDGYCLVQGSESTAGTNYEKIDCVGDWNGDPGSGWAVCGVADAIKDHTLVRKSSVVAGNGGDWSASAGTDAGNCEWIVREQDYLNNLGFHQFGFTCDCANTGFEGTLCTTFYGCTDTTACNYNAAATDDDGNCAVPN